MTKPDKLRRQARDACARAIRAVTGKLTEHLQTRALDDALNAIASFTIATATERHSKNLEVKPDEPE